MSETYRPVSIGNWNDPELLAFDVVHNPVPMREWSIYKDLEVQHLDHIFVSNRGEFRIERRGEATVLHGATWYTREIWPQWYWGSIADSIVHGI